MQSDDVGRRPEPVHQLGQDLSLLSIDEIDSRISALREEIARLEAERRSKGNSRSAAEALFGR